MGTLTVRKRLAEDGFAVIEPVLSAAEVDALLAATATLEDELGQTGRGGLRNVLQRVPALAELVKHPVVAAVVEDAIGSEAFAVRGILFDKHPTANWKVFWHQDLTVAVREKADVPGYGPWSSKAGFPHVQPPVEILEQMIAVRVHLDPCGPENGPLRVIPGSHRRGRLGPAEIEGCVRAKGAWPAS